MDELIALLVAAVLVESVINVIEMAGEKIRSWQFWGSIVVGVLVAFTYGLDLFAVLGFDAAVPYVGIVLTGLVFSRGANYVADILSRIKDAAENNG